MKNIFPFGNSLWLRTLLLLLLGPAVAQAQAPAWQTAVAATGSTSEVQATAADASGNVYLTGTFSGTVGFGGIMLTSAGRQDVFVAKWSSSTNQFVWAQRAGGAGDELAATIAVNGTSIYIAGRFAGTATFGTVSLASAGSDDGFIAKLTDAGASGAFVWAFGMGGRDSESAAAVVVDGPSVYVGGSLYSATAGFGNLSLTNFSTGSVLPADGFVAKLTDAGATANFAWVQQVGGLGTDQVLALATTAGGVYATGNFSNTASFGPAVLTGGTSAAFVTKLADVPTGNRFAWAIGTTSTNGGTVVPKAMAVSGANAYIVGQFYDTLNLGAAVLSSNGGSYDAFVAKITDAGPTATFAWAAQAGGPQSDYAAAVAASGNNLLVAGVFSGVGAFGNGSLSSVGSDDAFVAKLTDAGPSGNFAWATQAGGAGSDQANAVVLSGSKAYVGGVVAPPGSFGPVAVTSPVGATVAFLASLTDPTFTTARSALLNQSLSLFPNPAHNRATVQLPPVPGARKATLTLLDALGRTLRTQTAAFTTAGLRTELEVSGLPTGVYFVRVATESHTATRCLVVD